MPRLLFALLGVLLILTPVSAQSDSNQPELEALVLLDFDTFVDESYYLLVSRSPETVIELTLQAEILLESATLDDVSEEYQRVTAIYVADVLAQLQQRDRDALNPAQQVTYDTYEWYLEDQLQSYEFRLYSFPVTFFATADHVGTGIFFTEIHPLNSLEDAQDYITRLQLVDEKFAQVADNVRLHAEAGIIPPQTVIQWTMRDLNRLSSGNPREHDYYVAFEGKIAEIASLDSPTQAQLLDDAADAIEDHVKPAYQILVDTLLSLTARSPQEAGSWQYPDGVAFYEYALRHFTTTDLSADDIHELGLQELERIHAEMHVQFEALGYDSTDSIRTLYGQLIRDEGLVPAGQVAATFETLITDTYPRLDAAFSRIPDTDVIVIGGDNGGYYIPAAVDGTRPGAFYADVTRDRPYYNMPSLLYHETLPGHHLQIAWAQEQDMLVFRRTPLFTAYIEGWALYAERLAYELGWYEDDPVGNLGRLQYEAFRAARLVVDTGLHTRQWSINEATRFFADNTGFSEGMAQGQVMRYIVWPGQATAYMVGMLEILRLRDEMQSSLGDDFDLIAFHDLVLNSGSVPLPVLEEIIRASIE